MQFFGGLVLGCIEADLCKSRRTALGTRPSKLLANCPGGRNFSFFRRHWSIGPQAGRRRWHGLLLSAVTRARGPLLSAVTQQRLRAPALGGTARCCRVLHLKMPLSFHGAKARTAVLHPEILQSVVLRLRTTGCKISLPFVPLHHGMTEAFSVGCSTNILTSPCVMHDDSS